MLKSKLMPTIMLSAICIITVALLALVNLVTEPQIEKNQYQKLQDALCEVMPDGGEFTEIELSNLPSEVTSAYKASDGGYVFQVSSKGFKTGLVVICGIDKDGKITGAKCIQSSETNGKEHILGEKYVGKDSENYSEVEIISNSTKTCEGYRNAIRLSFESFKILTGGTK